MGLVAAVALVYGLVFAHPTAAAFGVAALAVIGVVYAIARSGLRGIRISRTVRESAVEGDEVEVVLHLESQSRWSVFLPLIYDCFTPEFHTHHRVLFPFRIRPGESLSGRYTGRCLLPRGVYRLGPTTIVVSDPLGWFRLRKTVAIEQELKVYPRFGDYGVDERCGDTTSLLSDMIHRAAIGESLEFATVRDYRPGDPLRHVHWPLTAHRGFPVVREFARTSRGDLTLYLDLYQRSVLGIGRGSSLEQSVKITAALGASALRRGYRVATIAWGPTRRSLPLVRGAGQLQVLLDLLVTVKPNGEVPLDEVLERTRAEIPTGGTVVVPISPYLRTSKAFERRLVALRRSGCRVVAVVYDDATYRRVYDDARPGESAEAFAHGLRARGIDVFVIPCAADLAAAFREGAALAR